MEFVGQRNIQTKGMMRQMDMLVLRRVGNRLRRRDIAVG